MEDEEQIRAHSPLVAADKVIVGAEYKRKSPAAWEQRGWKGSVVVGS